MRITRGISANLGFANNKINSNNILAKSTPGMVKLTMAAGQKIFGGISILAYTIKEEIPQRLIKRVMISTLTKRIEEDIDEAYSLLV